LTKELSICHESITSLRNENASLNSKVKKLNVCHDSISSLRNENASLVSKIKECRDINIEAIDDHLALIKQQNDHIAQLTTKINEHEIENEKI
jgi:predicted RNase H-like nuclease (RuvC/YqgF family)